MKVPPVSSPIRKLLCGHLFRDTPQVAGVEWRNSEAQAWRPSESALFQGAEAPCFLRSPQFAICSTRAVLRSKL